MKKVILLVAAMLLSTVGFAQISGSTTSGVAPLLPGAPGTANRGLSIQNGDDNKVRVRQAGEENSVLTEQDNGMLSGGNLAYVVQTGEVNANSGYLNAAEVNQSGEDNQSTTIQEGDENNARTNQGQNDGGNSARNKARIQQGIGQQAQNNYATIDQDGNDNQAQTLQIYDNSSSWTKQVGNDNKSMVLQDAGPNQTSGHLAKTRQDGNGNESSIDQSGNGGRNDAYAAQYGDYNQSKQLQVTSATSADPGNRGWVRQGRDATSFAEDDDTFALAMIYGDDNPDDYVGVFAAPFSHNAIAFQTQYGKMNEAEILQFGGSSDASNYAEQVQAGGWNNDAGIIQHHGGTAGDNYAKQWQRGDNNEAGLIQAGSGNKGLQTQRGHRNDVNSWQQGDSNLLNVHQRGNDNAATSAQRGLGNAALIVQHDGQSYMVEQNLDLPGLDLSAGGNQADILQVGPDGNFGVDYAIECDFDDPRDPTMNYDVPELQLGDICPDC